MKTEDQVMAKLESVTAEIERFAGQATEDTDTTQEQKYYGLMLLSEVVILAWILDCEEALKGLIKDIKFINLKDAIVGLEKRL